MKILIVGKNQINKELESRFKNEGLESIIINDAASIKSFKGEVGDFTINTSNCAYSAGFVVVTEESRTSDADVDGGKPIAIDENTANLLVGADFNTPIVFLLDYITDSSEADTILALKTASMLAANKRKVIYLSRFVRTAGNDIENLYRQARNTGVTFIKYESLEADYDNDNCVYNIAVSDGVIDLSFKTPHLVVPKSEISEIFLTLAKKIRIKTYKGIDCKNEVNQDRYFLNPAITSRKGVYYLKPSSVDVAVKYILSIISESAKKLEKVSNYAIVDPYKCAFCYTCYRACPHAAMEPDIDAAAMVNNNFACEGCGICAAVCPASAITTCGEKAQPVKKNGKMKIYCCENSAEFALKQILPELGATASKIDFESIQCGGRISDEDLSETLCSYNKVVVAVCMDNACKHFEGNKRAKLVCGHLAAQLEKAGVNHQVEYLQVSHAMTNVLKDKLNSLLGN